MPNFWVIIVHHSTREYTGSMYDDSLELKVAELEREGVSFTIDYES